MIVSQVLEYLYPNATPNVDYEVWDDGNGQYIAEWNLDSPQPTTKELEATFESAEFKAWQNGQTCDRIDAETGKEILKQTHPLCGIEETLAILRDEIRLIRDGKESSEKFLWLETIALAEIEKGRIKKDELGV